MEEHNRRTEARPGEGGEVDEKETLLMPGWAAMHSEQVMYRRNAAPAGTPPTVTLSVYGGRWVRRF